MGCISMRGFAGRCLPVAGEGGMLRREKIFLQYSLYSQGTAPCAF